MRHDPVCLEGMEDFVAAAVRTLRGGGCLLACGNGGSMSQAMHFAEEWTGRFRRERPPLPALALSDPTVLSCIANDYGYEEVFARQVEAHATRSDLLVLLSTTGSSPNLLRAAGTARDREVGTVALLGNGGGKLAPMVDVPIIVPEARTSDRIQEVHLQILHAVIESVEEEVLPSS
jgi:D-sedoheptulose 7-phosphate isomerase